MFTNYLSRSLLIAIAIQLICQFFKVILYSLRDKKFNFRYFFSPGGFPSAHSAFVSALSTGVGINAGFNSEIFAVSFVFSAIVIYDAFRLRKTVELHSMALNSLFNWLKSNSIGSLKRDNADNNDVFWLKVRFPEMVGHSLAEIIAGIIVGVGLTVFFFNYS